MRARQQRRPTTGGMSALVAVGAVAAVALVGTSVPAGGGERGAERRNVTFGLELEDVEIVSFDPDDDEEEFVLFEFEDRVDDIADPEGFALVGITAEDEVRAVVAQRNRDDTSEVIVGFEPGTDVRSFTLATVDAATVLDIDQEGNPPDSHSLGGATVDLDDGRTTGPDLVGVRRQRVVQRMVFGFDEDLDEGAEPSPRSFGFYTEDGAAHRAVEVESVSNRTVTVSFSERAGDQVGEAVRAFVLAGAVSDDQGNGNPHGARGGDTTLPDLEEVDAQADGTLWEFRFDDEVIDASAQRFALVTAAGRAVRADAVTRGSDDSVIAVFEDIADIAGDVVLAVALPGAVDGTGAVRTGSTLGVDAVEAADLGDGPTVGPDLEDVSVDDDSGLVAFRFDEDLDLDEDIDAEDFALITVSGAIVPGRTVSDSDDDEVIVVFGAPAVDGAAAFTIAPGAVVDEAGNGNPLRTISG